MSTRSLERLTEANASYWASFESHLATLPRTGADRNLREALVAVARAECRGHHPARTTPREHADLAYRIRFGLSQAVRLQTLDEVGVLQMRAAADLLDAGVRPESLGLVAGEEILR